MSFRKEALKMVNDKHRPKFHFAASGLDAYPGDPNGAFYADGEYHLMYLYRNHDMEGYHWGHIKSRDLLHWEEMPDALTIDNDEGCFSGGAFLDDDGTAYLTFWKFIDKDGADNSGIAIAYSKPPYVKWERIAPIAVNASYWGIKDIEIDGETVHVGNADPSNIWKIDDTYYMQLGNLVVLNEFGRKENSEEKYKGDWTELYKSKDLKNWEYVHRFYKNDHSNPEWPDVTEDDMCPSFLPLPDRKTGGQLTDSWLQLFIAHNRGCQYYIGKLNDETFYPEKHGRMSWNYDTYFAPEALIDDKNRHIMWVWFRETPDKYEKYGWAGVYSFPRLLWLENGELHMAPADELDMLEYGEKTYSLGAFSGKEMIDFSNGEQFRIKAEIDLKENAGFIIKADEEFKEYIEITVDRKDKKLRFKSVASGKVEIEEAPFELRNGEMLYMDIFADKSVFEVYVNERQAIGRRIYIERDNTKGIYALSDGSKFENIKVCGLSSTNYI